MFLNTIFFSQLVLNLEKSIDIILGFYKHNKIKRIHQFDVIIASDYTIINSCEGQISFNDSKGIFFEKTDDKTLAVLLFLMANMPLVQPSYNENIFNNASYRDDWNKILEEIEND